MGMEESQVVSASSTKLCAETSLLVSVGWEPLQLSGFPRSKLFGPQQLLLYLSLPSMSAPQSLSPPAPAPKIIDTTQASGPKPSAAVFRNSNARFVYPTCVPRPSAPTATTTQAPIEKGFNIWKVFNNLLDKPVCD
jgi:hypothetical protein